ncbi:MULTISPECIES: zinc ribbon domain-containing protein [Anaerolinea]|uniref:zinc ribbon domain-containing protein n=1 Tax=Anaerolinea TaxID=233189 RepID=UPI00260E8FA7|nr:C4-type zinc ribbon domain-containing protein [Anaerolinea thermophila]
MNQSAHLYRLQQIDSQLDQIHARLKQIEKMLSEDSRILDARKKLEETHRQLEKSRFRLHNAEELVRQHTIKIEQTTSTLYSGSVRNPKELQDLEKELASLKKHLETLEDQQLEAMMAVEQNELLEKEASEAYQKTLGQVISEQAGLSGEREQLEKTKSRLETERQAICASIRSENLQIYEQLRSQKKGVAVTLVEENSCSACGATIRASEVQAARMQPHLIFCNSCGRILYSG